MTTYRFVSDETVAIDAAVPNQIVSRLTANNIEGSTLDLNVKVDINHTYTQDLVLRLISPQGLQVLLVNRRGGSGDNFEGTGLDDEADIAVGIGNAPFQGDFRPEQPLSSMFNGQVNGIWTLEIDDQAAQDGGNLNSWELEIITDHQALENGPFLFHNRTPQTIDAGASNTVESRILVQGISGNASLIKATLDVSHSYNRDLKISLVSPEGTEVLLVDKEGADQDDFKETTFDDNASEPIAGAQAPFRGSFRPEGSMSDFVGEEVTGEWVLRIEDQANFDGGSLNFWTLVVETDSNPVTPDRPYQIQIRFLGGLTASQQAIFQEAAQRWSEVIVGNIPPFDTDIGRVDDLVIDAQGLNIDGPGGVLGQAGPTQVRPGSLLPARGIMEFDSGDLQRMEDEGELLDVIIHEIGHVLGIGTLWSHLGLIQGSGSDDPLFVGMNAMREFGVLKSQSPTPVPIANTGGPGTREGHWREAIFDDELMTGFDDPGRNALSRLTIASVQDLGYVVNYAVADTYFLPFAILSSIEVSAKSHRRCNVSSPEIEILAPENRIDV